MVKENKKILLIAYLPSQLTEIIRAAKLINSGEKYKPILLYIDDFASFDFKRYKKIFENEKITIINIFGDEYIKPRSVINKKNKGDLIRNKFKQLIPLWNYVYLPMAFINKIKNKIELTENLLRKIKPELILLTEESPFAFTSIISKTAQKYSIPSIILPYLYANQIEFAENLYSTNEVKNLLDRIVVRLFPQWQLTYKHRKLILLPGWMILIMEMMKISPPKPWVIHSGYTQAIAVESLQMKKYYLNNGLPESKLVMTGSIVDDAFYEMRRNSNNFKKRLIKNYHLSDKPIILCALPSPMLERLDNSFTNYLKLLEFWITSLIKISNFNIIFNLHPHIDYERVKYLEDLGISLYRQDIAQFIPFCDIYVASISSTIRWAIAHGKPVINYDVYKIGYHEYDDAKGVITVNTQIQFLSELKKLTDNEKYLKNTRKKQELCMKDWGKIDGKSGMRIMTLIENLIKRKPS